MSTPAFEAKTLDIGQVVRSVLTTLKSDGIALATLAFFIVGLPSLVGTLILWWQTTTTTPVFWLNPFFVSLPTVISFSILHAVIVWRLLPALAAPLSAGDRYENAWRRIWAVVILIGLTDLCLGAASAFVVPGFFLMVIWIVALPALLIEQRSVLDALQRSAVMTRGNRWRVLALVLIYGVFAVLSEVAVTAAIDGLTLVMPLTIWLDWIVLSLSSVITSVIQAVVGGVGIVAIYRSLVEKRSGLESEQTAAVFD